MQMRSHGDTADKRTTAAAAEMDGNRSLPVLSVQKTDNGG
jgi:hypothetical protein